MPMIDVYATVGTFANPKALARDLASTLMKIEQVPNIPMFRNNTAEFIHDLPDGALSNGEGDDTYSRARALSNAGAFNGEKLLSVGRHSTGLVATRARRPSPASRDGAVLPKGKRVGPVL